MSTYSSTRITGLTFVDVEETGSSGGYKTRLMISFGRTEVINGEEGGAKKTCVPYMVVDPRVGDRPTMDTPAFVTRPAAETIVIDGIADYAAVEAEKQKVLERYRKG